MPAFAQIGGIIRDNRATAAVWQMHFPTIHCCFAGKKQIPRAIQPRSE
jgi:hypothetical protein